VTKQTLEPPTDLPTSLSLRWEQVAARLSELPPGVLDDHPLAAATLPRVAVCSDFALSVLLRQPEKLINRLRDRSALSPNDVAAGFDLHSCDEATAMRNLRQIRQTEMARIAWQDLSGWADLATNLSDLSALAGGAIQAVLQFAADQLERRYGRPVDESGREAPLLVLAMGKLGGNELNFSSDIDLVFLHPDGGETSGVRGIDTEGYYRRLAQLVVRLLDQITGDGFVFRVDTRLRPFGNSGPLTVGISALETYLIRHGRDWERYAYLKARLLGGDDYAAEVFDQILTPFVFRQYLDFGVFESLRKMKALIQREVARKSMAENIKLGPGGIREIEFIVQASQLVRGGRDPALRERNLLAVLPRLVSNRQFTKKAALGLASAYRYLRVLENRLQAMSDKQTHSLPNDSTSQAILAYAMNEPSWKSLLGKLENYRQFVERQFSDLGLEAADDDPANASTIFSVHNWQSAWEACDFSSFLSSSGLDHNEEIATILTDLRQGSLYRRMDEISRQRLVSVLARLVTLVCNGERPANTLRRVVPVLRAIGRRSAYLALLNENPMALDRLLSLARQSRFLIRMITAHPALLDELLDARTLEEPPTRVELETALQRFLESTEAGDVESVLDAIRQFQRASIFRIAVADRFAQLPLMRVSDLLTDTAEIVLRQAFDTAWAESIDKYGRPMCGDRSAPDEAGFAIVAYGKLGGLELGYGSDLDLVFIFSSPGSYHETNGGTSIDNAAFFAKLGQRLIHFLSIQTSSGRLYEIDTRLRPRGTSGFLVTGIEAFQRYQQEEAWVWEHQALLRSRAVAGSSDVQRQFEEVRLNILSRHVNTAKLRSEITRMREKMREELSRGTQQSFDLKQDRGGLADIEFLVDYWVLSTASELPELTRFTDNVRQLEALQHAGLVPAENCQRLIAIYLALRQRLHELALDDGGRLVAQAEFDDDRNWVSSLWDDTFSA
jgi:[glutamine synthetase] adenylyltransferase / [glutamine synthetase]-adenylyl-L-tyrosine phosphorylase